MSSPVITEAIVEEASLTWFQELGYTVLHGQDIAPDQLLSERAGYTEVVLRRRLRDTLRDLNPQVPEDAVEEAFRKLLHPETASLIENNRRFHRMLVEGISVEYRRPDGTIGGDLIKVIDFDNPDNNNWLAVDQFVVIEGRNNRRPDILVFINGLPLGIIELKNIGDENATVK